MSSSDAPGLTTPRFQLGEWLIDPAANVLSRGDDKRHLRAKAMELLLLLMQRPNETISREEIVEKIWAGNEAVAAQGINNAIWSIRQVLDDDADAPRYLLTVPKKGYRLIATVQPIMLTPSVPETPPAVTTETVLMRQGWAKQRWPWLLLIAALILTAASINWRPAAPTAVPVLANSRPLTSYPGMEYLGQLSPDGKLLAFAWWQNTGKGVLYLRKADDETADRVRVSELNVDVTSLAWSADNNRLAYTALDDRGACQVAVYELQSNRSDFVGDCVAMWTPTLAWSPDEDVLVYTARLPDQHQSGLLLHDLTTGQKRPLTASDGALPDHQPAWSPDGRTLAFVRANKASGHRDIFLSDRQGNVRQLSRTPLQDMHGLSWHQHGRTLIYSTTLHGSRVLWQLDVASGESTPTGLEGSAPQSHKSGLLYSLLKKHQRIGKLMFEPGRGRMQPFAGSVTSEQAPDYSPTQQALVFVSARSGHRELWRADADGLQPRQLTDGKRLVQRPRWSPDGKQIAFVGVCEAQRYGLCLLDVATGRVTTLNSEADDFETPVWRDDGLALYVIAERNNKRALWQIARDHGSKQEHPLADEPTQLQKRPNETSLYFLTRAGRQLRQYDPERRQVLASLLADDWPINVVAWLPLSDGVLVMQREQSELWQRRTANNGAWQVLAEFPLGTFAEFPSLSRADSDQLLYVEFADTGYADLMLAPE